MQTFIHKKVKKIIKEKRQKRQIKNVKKQTKMITETKFCLISSFFLPVLHIKLCYSNTIYSFKYNLGLTFANVNPRYNQCLSCQKELGQITKVHKLRTKSNVVNMLHNMLHTKQLMTHEIFQYPDLNIFLVTQLRGLDEELQVEAPNPDN